MKVAVLQYNPIFGKKEANLRTVEKMLLKANFDLIVLPELFATGYLFLSKKEVAGLSEEISEGPTVAMMLDLCKRKNAFSAFGFLEKANGNFYNSALLVGPKGILLHYRKIHLFFEEKKWFSPGNLPLSVTSVKGAQAGIMICFDWRFPETARTLALKGADLILHPSNLVLPHCPDAMVTRALENNLFTLTADRTGVEKRGGKMLRYIGQSEIVAPNGKILLRLGKTEEKIGVVQINPLEARKKKINRYNDLFKDRKPEFYEGIEKALAS
jgi:predicted amidohydrolase